MGGFPTAVAGGINGASGWCHITSREKIRPFPSLRPAVCGSRARDYNRSSGNNTGGHGDQSFAVKALGGRPAGKMTVAATAGGSHKISHEGRAIRHLPC